MNKKKKQKMEADSVETTSKIKEDSQKTKNVLLLVF